MGFYKCVALHYTLCIKFKPQRKGSRPFKRETQTKYGKAAPLWIDRELRSAGSSHSILFLIIIITYNEKKSFRGRPAILDVCCRHSPIRFRGEFSPFSKITWLFANSRPVVIWEKQQKPWITIGCAQPPGKKLIKQSVLFKKNNNTETDVERAEHTSREEYLLFLAGGLLTPQDAGVHGLHIFDHQGKQLIGKTERQLQGDNMQRVRFMIVRFSPSSDSNMVSSCSVTVNWSHLLVNAEGLVVEVLNEVFGHEVWVIRAAVHVLLLQEVHLDHDVADTLFGPVKLVVCH